MIDRLQITIEPNAIFFQDTGRPVVKDIRTTVVVDGEVLQHVKMYSDNEFSSLFDHIFEEAKQAIKQAYKERK